jgi:hypothetical protein
MKARCALHSDIALLRAGARAQVGAAPAVLAKAAGPPWGKDQKEAAALVARKQAKKNDRFQREPR